MTRERFAVDERERERLLMVGVGLIGGSEKETEREVERERGLQICFNTDRGKDGRSSIEKKHLGYHVDWFAPMTRIFSSIHWPRIF